MKLQLFAEDKQVAINGVWKPIDCSALLNQRIRVVQWDNDIGHLEFVNDRGLSIKCNEDIHSISTYQSYINAWYAYVPPTANT